MIGIRGFGPSENVAVKFRIRQVQNRLESQLIVVVERIEGFVEESLENGIEFAHAATAAPSEVGLAVSHWVGHETGTSAAGC